MFRLGFSEIEFLVAMRQQLGIDLDRLMGGASDSTIGDLCRASTGSQGDASQGGTSAANPQNDFAGAGSELDRLEYDNLFE